VSGLIARAVRGLARSSVLGLTIAGCWSLTTDVPDVFGRSGDGGLAAASDGAASGADGGGEGGGDPLFCAHLGRTPTLCADFEQDDLEAGWENLERDNGGTMELEPRAEGGHSLLVRSPPSGPDALALLHASRPGLPVEARLAFDLRADSFAPDGSAIVLAALRVNRLDGGYVHVDLWGRSHLGVVQVWSPEPPNGLDRDATESFPIGKWVHVEFHVVFTGEARATVSVDGTNHVDLPLTEMVDGLEAETDLQFGMSVGPPDPTQGATVLHYDNVVYDLTTR
jgi:hypothetical protein